MKARLIPAIKTPLTSDEAVKALWLALESAIGQTPRRESVAILAAQTALETGRWKKMWGFGWGNIKASADYEGLYQSYRCNEVIKGKVEWFDPPHPQCNFRAYASAEDGAIDYVGFLARRPRYAKAWQRMLAGDPAGFSHELKQAGYYTASEALYTKGLVSLYSEFLGLAHEPEKLPDEAVDHEHSTFTNEDFTVGLILTDVDWETFSKDRARDVAESDDEKTPVKDDENNRA